MRHTVIRILPHEPDLLFKLVGDVEQYPKFVPWVTGMRVWNRREVEPGVTQLDAEATVAFTFLREKFATRVRSDAAARQVDVNLLYGPFRRLRNQWRFAPHPDGCEVTFEIDFEFKTPLLDRLLAANFDPAVAKLMKCFEDRAQQLSGNTTPPQIGVEQTPHFGDLLRVGIVESRIGNMTSAAIGPAQAKVGMGVIFAAICAALFAGLLICAGLSPEFTRLYLLGELGFIESLQAALLAATFLLALWLVAAPRSTGNPGLRPWLFLIAVGLFLILGEEISWGQHYFGWNTTGWFHLNNDQGETNFHNTSSWLDQKPRSLLLLGVLVGGLIHPLVQVFRKGRGLIERPWWLAPTRASLGPAIFVVLGGMPERLAEWGLVPKLPYLRSSEVEELFLYLFMFSYLVVLAVNLKKRRT